MNQLSFSILLLLQFSVFAQNIHINEFMSSNSTTISDEDGDFSDWIELYNSSEFPINLSDYYLSDDPKKKNKWKFPDVEINAKSFFLVFASDKDKVGVNIHTNFKISASGEHLILSENETIIDIIHPIEIPTDKSYGRIKDGENEFGIFISPTPNVINNSKQLDTLIFSSSSQFYTEPFHLTLGAKDSIYYSFEYFKKQNLYQNEILINKNVNDNKYSLIPTSYILYNKDYWENEQFGWSAPTQKIKKATVVCAATFNHSRTSEILCNTYFIDEKKYSFPVISLITDSLNLFGYEQGIYVPGKNLNESNPSWSGNFYMEGDDWEKNAIIQYFDTDGKLQFSQNMGIQVHGGKSRTYPQKSLRFYARQEYGAPTLDFPLFKERPYNSYKRFILRSSFTFWWGRNSMFQDEIIHTLLHKEKIDVELQMTEPCILLVNGEYWGIHNIRERQDKYYLESLFNIDSDEVDIIQGNLSVIEGSADSYKEIISFVNNEDLSIIENYQYIEDRIDISNLIDYTIIQIYIGNYDWPQNNMKMWKPQNEHGKWRWLLYDLDAAMDNYRSNTIERFFALDYHFCLLVKKLLENEEFKGLFLERFKFHLQHTFEASKMQDVILEFENKFAPEMTEHINRWGKYLSYNKWQESVDYLLYYAEKRPIVVKEQLFAHFGIIGFTFNNEIKIAPYPNPCTDRINLELGDSKTDIYVMDASGKLVFESVNKSFEQQINTTDFPNGVYWIRLVSGDQSENYKIIKLGN